MAFANFLDKASCLTDAAGTGPITMGVAANARYQTWLAAGVVDALPYDYLIVQNADWEVGWGIVSGSGTVITRNLRFSSTGSLLNVAANSTITQVDSAENLAAIINYLTYARAGGGVL